MSSSAPALEREKVIGNFTRNEIDTLKQTVAKGTTDSQFALFMNTCINSNLNPFLNHIYCIVYQTKNNGPVMNVQISVEGIMYLARKVDGFRGVTSQMVHENDEFMYDASENKMKHIITFPRGKLLAGYAIAKRENCDDVVVFIEAHEVEHLKKPDKYGNPSMWSIWYGDMFKKHIVKRAAKQQYGIEITEDIQSAPEQNETESYVPGRVDITPEKPELVVVGEEEETVDPVAEMKKRCAEIREKQAKYGITKEELNTFVTEKFNSSLSKLALPQLVALSKLLDGYGTQKQKKQQEEADEMDFDIEME